MITKVYKLLTTPKHCRFNTNALVPQTNWKNINNNILKTI